MNRPARSTALPTVALAAVLLAGCSGGGGTEPAARASQTTTSTTVPLPATAPVPTATPTPPPTAVVDVADAPLDPLDWRSEPFDGRPIAVVPAGDDVIGLGSRGVVRLDADGATVWRWTPPSTAETVAVFVDVPVVDHAMTGGGRMATALDPETGRELWSAPSAGSVTGADGVVHLVSCADGACSMTARDARRGTVLWSTPVSGRAAPVTIVDGIVLARYEDAPLTYLVVDAATGAIVADRLRFGSRRFSALITAPDPTEPSRVRVRQDRDADDGCGVSVTLRAHDGSRRWTTAVAVGRDYPTTGPPVCRTARATMVGPHVAITGHGPGIKLLLGSDGREAWATREALVTTFESAAGVLLVRRDGRYVGIDMRSGDEVWELAERLDPFGPTLVGRLLVGHLEAADGSRAVVLDVGTGELLRVLPGRPLAAQRRDGGTVLVAIQSSPTRFRYGAGRLP